MQQFSQEFWYLILAKKLLSQQNKILPVVFKNVENETDMTMIVDTYFVVTKKAFYILKWLKKIIF